jgi:hypothetical protein
MHKGKGHFYFQLEQNKNANRVAKRKPANASQPDAETKNQKIFDPSP